MTAEQTVEARRYRWRDWLDTLHRVGLGEEMGVQSLSDFLADHPRPWGALPGEDYRKALQRALEDPGTEDQVKALPRGSGSADALLRGLLLRAEYPESDVVLAVPGGETYRALTRRTVGPQRKAGSPSGS